MNDIARHFLETYARGGEVDGGWKFGKALQQSRLDFSPGSLARVDHLLKEIRERAKPGREAFLADMASRNFSALLAYYLVEVVVRRTGAGIEWHDLASARARLPDGGAALPDDPTSRLLAIAPDAGCVVAPLVWIHARLFADGPGPSASVYVDGVVADLEAHGPPTWWTAARALGFSAAWQMSMVADGGRTMPHIVHPAADGQRLIQSLAYDDGGAAVERGESALRDNVAGAPWQVFARDAFANLPDGSRTDAIVVDVHTYGDQPLQLKVVFPYRPAGEGGTFLIRDAIVAERNVPWDTVQRLFAAIDGGVQSYTWPSDKSWNDYREPDAHAPPAPAPATALAPSAAPLTYANGELVQVGDAALSDAGFFPVRVVLIPPDERGQPQCVYQDARGLNRVLTAAQAREQLQFVARNPPDHHAACIAWLEHQVQHGSREKGANGAATPQRTMLSAGHARHALGNLHWLGMSVEKNIGMAIRLWQAGADSGYAPAEYEIANLYLNGDAVKADPVKALNFLRRSADKGHPRALGRLGGVLEDGEGVPVDLAQAVVLLTKAAAAGHATSMYRLARMHQQGKGLPRDAARGLALLHDAAQAGSSQAQYELGLHYSADADGAPDYARCVHWYEQAVLAGHRGAINNLADKYEHGLGVAQDLPRAVELYRRAADMNIAAAWYSLGAMAAEGRGLPQDFAEAVRWMKPAAEHGFKDAKDRLASYERALNATHLAAGERALEDAASLEPQALHDIAGKLYEPSIPETLPVAFRLYLLAARRGHANAQHQLAFRYRRGLGVEKSAPLALEWYERAAAQANVYALEDLGEVLETGELGPANAAMAFDCARRAAEAGAIFAPYRLARMYEDGRGTARDLAEALRWMQAAARHQLSDSVRRVEALRVAIAATKPAAEPASSRKKSGWKLW